MIRARGGMLTAIIIEQEGVFIHDASATSACRVTSCARIDFYQGKIIPDTSNMSFGHAGLPGDVSCDTEVARPRKLCTTSHLDFIMSVWERIIWSSLFCKSLFRPQPRIHMPWDATHSSSDFLPRLISTDFYASNRRKWRTRGVP